MKIKTQEQQHLNVGVGLHGSTTPETLTGIQPRERTAAMGGGNQIPQLPVRIKCFICAKLIKYYYEIEIYKNEIVHVNCLAMYLSNQIIVEV